jgi:hypothetical protein
VTGRCVRAHRAHERSEARSPSSSRVLRAACAAAACSQHRQCAACRHRYGSGCPRARTDNKPRERQHQGLLTCACVITATPQISAHPLPPPHPPTSSPNVLTVDQRISHSPLIASVAWRVHEPVQSLALSAVTKAKPGLQARQRAVLVLANGLVADLAPLVLAVLASS